MSVQWLWLGSCHILSSAVTVAGTQLLSHCHAVTLSHCHTVRGTCHLHSGVTVAGTHLQDGTLVSVSVWLRWREIDDKADSINVMYDRCKLASFGILWLGVYHFKSSTGETNLPKIVSQIGTTLYRDIFLINLKCTMIVQLSIYNWVNLF